MPVGERQTTKNRAADRAAENKMADNREIPIFFAVDDGYCPFLAVAIQSLIDHASPEYTYSIKVLNTDIGSSNKQKISKYERENVSIEFVDLNYYMRKVMDKLYTRDYYSKSTYYRLFIPNLYPQYDKALYLDSDIVVLDDIAALYHTEMGDDLVAAAPDDIIQFNPVFQTYVEKVVGVADYRRYFNAGVLLMNLDQMRRFRFQEKFVYLLDKIRFQVAQDQDYLNRLCKGRVTFLDRTWNRMPIEDPRIKLEDVKLVHYNLAFKPWHFEDILYQEFFWMYASETEYFEQIQEIQGNYTQEDRIRDAKNHEKLKKLAKRESDCVGDDRKYRR